MCGRASCVYGAEDLLDFYKGQEIQNNWNVKPTEKVLVLISSANSSAAQLVKMKWGIRTKHLIINCRDINKPPFASFNRNRCVFVCSGYYEWKLGTPYYIYSPKSLLFMTGIYQKDEFCILTQEALGAVSKVHHRMPTFVPREQIDLWLNPNYEQGVNADIIAKSLQFHPVSSAVSKVSSNGPDLIQPVHISRAQGMEGSKPATQHLTPYLFGFES